MYSHSPSRASLVFAAAAVMVLLLAAGPVSYGQKPGKGAAPTPAPAPASGGLFPDAVPALVEKASLRNLLETVRRKDMEGAAPMIWQLVAAMAKARESGVNPSEYLAAGYRAERLKGSDAADVQNCLLSAWSAAQTMALLTPENLALMERGTAPRATRGRERGLVVYLDLNKLPLVTMTANPAASKPVALPAAPLPENEPVVPSSTFVVRTVELRLHEKIALDAFGLKNMDFRLDSVDPHGSVIFLYDDRTIHRPEVTEQVDTLRRGNKNIAVPDPVHRMTAFWVQPIPDSKIQGVKLVAVPFAGIYLDQDVGVGVTFRLVIRVNSEALELEKLPPERRKLYEVPLNP
jgi:hypothetical protein